MTQIIKAACIQMNSGPHIVNNIDIASGLIREAASEGAQFIATPEVTDQVVSNRAEKIDQTHDQDEHPAVQAFSDLAKGLKIDLLIGSMCIKMPSGKIANRSFHFGVDGQIKNTYDKIHLFDVDLPTGESHRESKLFEGGEAAVLSELHGIKMGLSICYDLRFPHLYRNLAKLGAQILTVPAAFTVPTGKAHWEVLLRARAIENGAFVIAPAQCGDHEGARQTYGHSMMIGPWGNILAKAKDADNLILADLDMDDILKARQSIPSLMHDKEFQH